MSEQIPSLKGRWALILGASSGFGAAASRALARAGMNIFGVHLDPRRSIENAKAVNASAGYGIDDVIDPADTRSWLVMGLNSVPPTPERTTKKYPYIDPW